MCYILCVIVIVCSVLAAKVPLPLRLMWQRWRRALLHDFWSQLWSVRTVHGNRAWPSVTHAHTDEHTHTVRIMLLINKRARPSNLHRRRARPTDRDKTRRLARQMFSLTSNLNPNPNPNPYSHSNPIPKAHPEPAREPGEGRLWLYLSLSLSLSALLPLSLFLDLSLALPPISVARPPLLMRPLWAAPASATEFDLPKMLTYVRGSTEIPHMQTRLLCREFLIMRHDLRFTKSLDTFETQGKSFEKKY